MPDTHKNLDEFEFLQSLKQLAQAYEEISVIKMQRTKSSVFANRDYISKLSSVFYDVKVNYEDIKKKQEAQKRGSPFLAKRVFTTANKNGKTVSVFISSRDKLYGDIIKKIFHLFQFQVFLLGNNKTASDVVIIGRYGKKLFDELPNHPTYTFYDLPDTNISPTEMGDLMSTLNKYEKVNVFFGKLENVMTQNATVANVSGQQELSSDPNHPRPKESYFFEPSVEKIMNFFETQVFNSLFYQTLHETELARLASRIRAMEEALGNIEKNEASLYRDSRRVRQQQLNKKQLDTLAGIKLWKNRK